MMLCKLLVLAILSSVPYLAFSIAIPQSDSVAEPMLDKRKAEVIHGVCDPTDVETNTPLPVVSSRDLNQKQRVRRNTDPPNPQDYEYAEQPLKDEPKAAKFYIDMLLGLFDAEAQSHRDFDEPIPVEGYTIKVNHEGIWLKIIQKGDNNLVWGNVKNAIAVMKRYYQQISETSTYQLEVAILHGAYPEGYVRMVKPFRGCSNVE